MTQGITLSPVTILFIVQTGTVLRVERNTINQARTLGINRYVSKPYLPFNLSWQAPCQQLPSLFQGAMLVSILGCRNKNRLGEKINRKSACFLLFVLNIETAVFFFFLFNMITGNMRRGDWMTHTPWQVFVSDNSQVKGYVYHSVCSHLLSSSITKSKLRMYIGHFRLLFGFRIWGVWSPANARMTLSPSILSPCYFKHITHTCSQKYKSSCTCVYTDTHTLAVCNTWWPTSEEISI